MSPNRVEPQDGCMDVATQSYSILVQCENPQVRGGGRGKRDGLNFVATVHECYLILMTTKMTIGKSLHAMVESYSSPEKRKLGT